MNPFDISQIKELASEKNKAEKQAILDAYVKRLALLDITLSDATLFIYNNLVNNDNVSTLSLILFINLF